MDAENKRIAAVGLVLSAVNLVEKLLCLSWGPLKEKEFVLILVLPTNWPRLREASKEKKRTKRKEKGLCLFYLVFTLVTIVHYRSLTRGCMFITLLCASLRSASLTSFVHYVLFFFISSIFHYLFFHSSSYI